MASALRKVQAPPGAQMNSKFEYAVTHRRDVPEKTPFEPLDPCNNNATNRVVWQLTKPNSELW